MAKTTIALAIAQSRGRIDAWTARRGPRPNLVLNYVQRTGGPIGRSMARGARVAQPCDRALVVLRWLEHKNLDCADVVSGGAPMTWPDDLSASERFPALAQFVAGYLHQDLVAEHGTPAGAVLASSRTRTTRSARPLARELASFSKPRRFAAGPT